MAKGQDGRRRENRPRALSESEGCSEADLIRDALGTYARKVNVPTLPGIGEFDSGRLDTSERADEILNAAAKRGRWC